MESKEHGTKIDGAEAPVADPVKDAQIRRRVMIGVVSNYAGKLINLGIWFFLTPYLLSNLGPSAFGLWVLITSVAAYGGLLEFGIGAGVSKYVAEYQARGELARARQLVATSFWLYTISGAVVFMLSAALAPAFPRIFNIPEDQSAIASWLVVISGGVLAVSFPSYTVFAVLRGFQRFELTNLIGTIGMVLMASATVAALYLGWGLVGVVAINIPVTLLVQIPAIWMVHRIAPELRFAWRGANRDLVRELVGFSSSLFVINLATQVQLKTDEIVIGLFLPLSRLTPYSLARRLSEIPQALSEQFVTVLLPLSSQLDAERDQTRLRAVYLASTRMALASSVALACGIAILARAFLGVWVGAEYSPYAYLVTVLLGAGLMVTSQWPAGVILQGMARHRYLAGTSILIGAAKLALSIALVRPYGLLGVALGSLIPATLGNLGLVLPYARRVLKIELAVLAQEVVLPTLAPALPMSLVLLFFRQVIHPATLVTIGLVGLVGLMVYLLVYLSFPASSGERRFFGGMFQNWSRRMQARVKQARTAP